MCGVMLLYILLPLSGENSRFFSAIMLSCFSLKVVVAYWKVKTPCHAHGECINECQV